VYGQTFKSRRDIGGFGFDKEYDLVQMRDLRVAHLGVNPFDISSSLQLWGVGGGVIAFDYGARTYRFGAGLDEAEAKQIVTAIKQRYRIPERTKT
jgi:tetrahydromethanopterin S-methyltransferase subunit E